MNSQNGWKKIDRFLLKMQQEPGFYTQLYDPFSFNPQAVKPKVLDNSVHGRNEKYKDWLTLVK
jgi:hypothetical protein